MKVICATSSLFPAHSNRPTSKERHWSSEFITQSIISKSWKYLHSQLTNTTLRVCLSVFFIFLYFSRFFSFSLFFFPFLFFPPKKRLFWIMLRFPILPIFGQKSTLCMHQPREISLQIHKLGLEWGLFWTKLLIASVLSVQDMNEFYIHSEVIWATSH